MVNWYILPWWLISSRIQIWLHKSCRKVVRAEQVQNTHSNLVLKTFPTYMIANIVLVWRHVKNCQYTLVLEYTHPGRNWRLQLFLFMFLKYRDVFKLVSQFTNRRNPAPETEIANVAHMNGEVFIIYFMYHTNQWISTWVAESWMNISRIHTYHSCNAVYAS